MRFVSFDFRQRFLAFTTGPQFDRTCRETITLVNVRYLLKKDASSKVPHKMIFVVRTVRSAGRQYARLSRAVPQDLFGERSVRMKNDAANVAGVSLERS